MTSWWTGSLPENDSGRRREIMALKSVGDMVSMVALSHEYESKRTFSDL